MYVAWIQVHLPGEERIVFSENSNFAVLLQETPNAPKTTLTAWFAFNERKKQEYFEQLAIDPTALPHICL